jgi:hypothetical protein
LEVKIDETQAKKMGGSCYVMLTKYGVKAGDKFEVYKNDKNEIVLKPKED